MPKFVFASQARESPHTLFLSKLTSVPLVTIDHFQFYYFISNHLQYQNIMIFNWGSWSQNALLGNVFIFSWQDFIPACVVLWQLGQLLSQLDSK